MPRARNVKRHPSGFANPSGYPETWNVYDVCLKDCKHCGEKFIRYGHSGRTRKFCCDACRKAASRRRQVVTKAEAIAES